MFLVLTASKDTYITNKIIANQYRATDANVGLAATMDLFKLYDESSYVSGTTRYTSDVVELSRGLIKFEYDTVTQYLSSTLDIDHPSFKCHLKMYDIMGGQATPSNFKLTLFPLSRSFDEGIGRDIGSYSDIDAANFVTSSFANSATNLWYVSGANASGSLDGANWGSDAQVDIIERGTFNPGIGEEILFVEQQFVNGSENLSMDITKLVSASLAGQLANHGFRLSFTSSQETDEKTRFVKRFATRHVSNYSLRPRIEISWNDSIHDAHKSFYFDMTGSLFLQNYHRGQGANIFSGTINDYGLVTLSELEW